MDQMEKYSFSLHHEVGLFLMNMYHRSLHHSNTPRSAICYRLPEMDMEWKECVCYGLIFPAHVSSVGMICAGRDATGLHHSMLPYSVGMHGDAVAEFSRWRLDGASVGDP
jgi:hypothetical protein